MAIITEEQVIRGYRRFSDFFNEYILHLLLCAVLTDLVSRGEYKLSAFQIAVLIGIIFLSKYSLVRARLLFDEKIRAAVKRREEPEKLLQRAAFLLGGKRFIVEYLIYAAVYMLLPVGFAYPALSSLFSFSATAVSKEIVLLIFLVAQPLLALLAFRSAKKVILGDVTGYTSRQLYRKKRINLLLAFAAYVIGGALLVVTLIGSIGGFGKLLAEMFLKRPIIGILVTAAIVLLISVSWAKAIYKRIRFYKKLKDLCREKGGEIVHKKRIFASLFIKRSECNMSVKMNGKTYAVGLYSVRQKRKTVVFAENDGYYLHKIVIGFGAKNQFTLMDWRTGFSYRFEGEGIKVLVLTSCAGSVMIEEGRGEVPADNGTRCFGYRIFTGTGFLNALMRDCVEKD